MNKLSEKRYWLAVASKDHVERGVQGGFMQVCHGKRAPLARVKAGDGVVYYSPKTSLSGGKPCQAFTAIGEVVSLEPYQVDMGGGFTPFRKEVTFYPAQAMSVRDLMDSLELTHEKNWGYQLRFGLVILSEADFQTIQSAMSLITTDTLKKR